MFQDTKEVISEAVDQRTETTKAKKKKDEKKNNDLQNTTHKTKDQGTRTLLNTEVRWNVSKRWKDKRLLLHLWPPSCC